MADYHFSAKPVQRSAGRTATAAAAYRAGVEIADTRTGEIHDYTRKGGVVSADIVLPEGGYEWAEDRSALWNAAEHAENRKDACVAREYEVSLPHELSPEARRELVLEFAKEMADREGCAVDVAIHEPGRGGDDRNHHAHILRTTRKVGADGLTDKLDTEKAGRNRREDLDRVRERWAEMTNAKLRQFDIQASVDHRSLKDRGIEREPTRHLGPTATGIERRTCEDSRRRKDMKQEAAERLAIEDQMAKDALSCIALEKRLAELERDLAKAKAEQAQEKEKATAGQVNLYAQALKDVTTETLATVPGILPVESIRQAALQVGTEIVAEYRKPENAAKQINLEYQTKELTQVLYRLEGGESAYQPPKHIYSLPEGVTRVIERARQIAVTMAATMRAVDLEAMVKKAVSLAWKKPEHATGAQLMKSRFVTTPGQDQPKIEQAKQVDNQRSGPRPGG